MQEREERKKERERERCGYVGAPITAPTLSIKTPLYHIYLTLIHRPYIKLSTTFHTLPHPVPQH